MADYTARGRGIPPDPVLVPWEISDEEARGSFEVVRVEDLPPVDREDIQVVLSPDRSCGCYWCQADWAAIARAAVTIFEASIDPLDQEAVGTRAKELGLNADDLGWLLGLFDPVDGIVVLRDSKQFTNGMHRTHALRMAGVDQCVVYTGRGELPYAGDLP